MQTYIKKTLLGILLVPFLSASAQSHSQDTLKQKQNGKTRVRIEKEVNGKTTVFDTTFDSKTYDKERIDKVMRAHDARMKDVDREMKRVEVYMQRFDSVMRDSLIDVTKRIYLNGEGLHQFHVEDLPGGFEFNFEIPEMPELPEMMELQGFAPGVPPVPHVRSYRSNGQTLGDVIGDIPMSNVTSYKIKETRDGKRIIIDVNDDAVLEKHDRVIVITRPPRHGRPAHAPRDSRKIERKIEKEEQIEKEEKDTNKE